MRLRRGLTLVELLVVLTILVALTTVAIRATEGTLQQSRYDATVRSLQEIEDAVLGPPGLREADGTLRVSGFLADVGRLPTAVDVGGTLYPQELWVQPASVAAFRLEPSSLDSDILLGTGWNGPYLRLAPGATLINDGWNVAFELDDTTGAAAAATAEVGAIRSPGDPDGGAFSATLQITFEDGAIDRVSGDLQVQVTSANGTDPVVVLLVETEDSPAGLREDGQDVTGPSYLHTFTGLVRGTKALRAYEGAGLNAADGLSLPELAGASRRSRVHHVAFDGRLASPVVLELEP